MNGQIVRGTLVFICVHTNDIERAPSKGLGARGELLKIVSEPASSAGAKEKKNPATEPRVPRADGAVPRVPPAAVPRVPPQLGAGEGSWAEQGDPGAGWYGHGAPASARGPRRGMLPVATTTSSACGTGACGGMRPWRGGRSSRLIASRGVFLQNTSDGSVQVNPGCSYITAADTQHAGDVLRCSKARELQAEEPHPNITALGCATLNMELP